ncbi:DsbA family protein [Magnetovibrio sp. PR-2]|uniref:DsbA family protein n=1 Tax=Magnetovibrio sp. PR-2 TaxID=3120356 RepID=UPI002FCDE261
MPTYTVSSPFWKSLSAAVFFMFGVVVTLPGSAVAAEQVTLEKALAEMSMGDPNAPVVLNEYSSLTCGHCANFHANSLPELKKKYVETGKVRIVFHDFPLDNLSVAAVGLARCAGSPRNVEFFDMLYQTQGNWIQAENKIGALAALARFYGLENEDVMACLQNEELMTAIQKNRDQAAAMYGIDSTPSFVLDGQVIKGALSADDMGDMLDKALEKRGVK